MAHFYGELVGSKGGRPLKTKTATGTVNGTLITRAASWSGSVRTELYRRGDEDWALVTLQPWRGVGESRELYHGPVARYAPAPGSGPAVG